MSLLQNGLLLSALCSLRVSADFILGSHPSPTDLSSNQSLVSASWQNLSSIFDDFYKRNSGPKDLTGTENVTFSVGMFSLHDPGASKLQYHYTSPEVKQAPNGTHEVDAESIYRVASVSKLITVLTGLISLQEEDWNRPLPDINSIFRANVSGRDQSDPIWAVQWDQITPWSLATQLSGLPTIGYPDPQGDVYNPANAQKYGAPLVDLSTWGECAVAIATGEAPLGCDANANVESINGIPPNFLPWSTPIYSDLNFMILGMVISNITGKSYSSMYQDALFAPLAMSSSSAYAPIDNTSLARSVIPNWLGFSVDGRGFTIPSGGLLSTISDLQKLGVSILNNTLLSPAATRKWMKPQSQWATDSYSIGAPWEIHRFIHTNGRTTDIYTKLGDSGNYGGALVLIPQYDAGFSFLDAASATSTPTRGSLSMHILDHITNTIVPALEAQAAAEAESNYVGTYESTDPRLNASITIEFNDTLSVYESHSKLQITNWMYNGTDVLAGPFFNGIHPRLQPSIPKQTPAGQSGQAAFLAQLRTANVNILTYKDAMQISGLNISGPWTGFYKTYGDFVYTDRERWAGVQAELIVFDVDGQGRATAVTPAVDRITLQRVEGR